MPYIDRDELRRWIEGEIKSPSCPVGERAFGRRILMKIATTPTADVVERKKGKWIKMSDTDGIYWSCSECGEDIPRVSHFDPQFDLFPRLESIEKTNFCPNCGADMQEGGAE